MTQSTALWQELVATALLGSARRVLTPAVPVATPLHVVLTRLPATDPEGALLGAAAALALYHQAGRLPPCVPQDAEPVCELDDLPRCRVSAAQSLALMLAGQYPGVLPEWLEAMAAARQRVPEEYLPVLLELGRVQPTLRVPILPVLGKRGHWLAAQNPDWEYAVESGDDETVWQTGSHDTRLRLIQRLRVTAPARARELVAATWATEAPGDRAAFLATFATQLSMSDEPFLEAALDDRRKEVRAQAAALLAHLPTSRLVQRQRERLHACLTWRGGSPGQLHVSLPESCDRAMLRDGIDPRPPGRQRVGEKGWWLQQMLAAVPPGHWCQRWHSTPVEILERTAPHEWPHPLRAGWLQATLRHQDTAWAEALLLRDPAQLPLLQVLSSARQETIILTLLQSLDTLPRPWSRAAWLSDACRHPWSPAFAHDMLAWVRAAIADRAHNINSQIELSAWFKGCGKYIPPHLLPDVETGWPTEARAWKTWAAAVEECVALLRFRAAMLKEIIV